MRPPPPTSSPSHSPRPPCRSCQRSRSRQRQRWWRKSNGTSCRWTWKRIFYYFFLFIFSLYQPDYPFWKESVQGKTYSKISFKVALWIILKSTFYIELWRNCFQQNKMILLILLCEITCRSLLSASRTPPRRCPSPPPISSSSFSSPWPSWTGSPSTLRSSLALTQKPRSPGCRQTDYGIMKRVERGTNKGSTVEEHSGISFLWEITCCSLGGGVGQRVKGPKITVFQWGGEGRNF